MKPLKIASALGMFISVPGCVYSATTNSSAVGFFFVLIFLASLGGFVMARLGE